MTSLRPTRIILERKREPEDYLAWLICEDRSDRIWLYG